MSFDRGTLRVDGDVATLSDWVRFDERTGFHLAVDVRADDPFAGQEVWRRAQALAVVE